MIVQCPSCSTGFNLPDKHITPKGAKLRCSKCNHVFRVRRVEGAQEIQFFYKPEDEASNIESGTHIQSRTQIGLATSDSIAAASPLPAGPTLSGDQDVPDADEGNSTSFGFGQRIQAPQTGQPEPSASPFVAPAVASPFGNLTPTSSDDLNPFGGDAENPHTIDLFEGDADPFADVFKGLTAGGGIRDSFSDLSQVSEADLAPSEGILKPSQPRALQRPGTQAPEHTSQEHAPAPVPQSNPLLEKTASEDIWAQGGQASSVMVQADDLVDESFGQDGPVFDAAQGIVEAKEANIPPRQPSRPPGRVSQQTFADTPSAKQGSALPQQPPPSPTRGPAAPRQEVWPSDLEAPIGVVGKSGAQKLVNTLFIFGVLTTLFLGFVASQNDMHLDFLHAGDMVKHAFGSGTYTPRQEWAPMRSKPAVAVAPPKDAIRPENIWVEKVATKQGEMLVLRGMMRNFSPQEFVDVKVRGVMLNEKGKILQEQAVHLGSLATNDALAQAPDLAGAKELLPTSSSALKGGSTQPFTVIFDSSADPDAGIFYRVDVAKQVSTNDL